MWAGPNRLSRAYSIRGRGGTYMEYMLCGAVLSYIHEPWQGCWPPSRCSFDWFATVISADRWPWLPSRHAPAPRQACTRVPAPLLSRCAMSPEFTQLSIPCTCQVQLSTLSFTGVLLIRAAPSNAPGRWGKCGSKPCENQHDQQFVGEGVRLQVHSSFRLQHALQGML